MNRGWYWRLGTVLFVIVGAFVVLWPSIPKLSTPWVRAHIPFRLNEGLDIRGGARLSYDVQIGQAIADRRARSMEDFRGQLASDFGIHHGEGRLTPDEITRLAERVTVAAGSTNREFVARFRNVADVARVNDRMVSNRGLRRLGTSGSSVTLGLDPREVTALEDSAVQQAIQTITNRIDELAVKETSITARGETIVVEVPGQDQAYFQQIRDIIRRTARLEFKILDDESPALAAIIAGQAIPGAPPAAQGSPAPTAHALPAGITQETELAPVGPGRNAQSTYLRSTGPNARQQLQDYLDSIRSLIPEGRQVLIGKSDRSDGAAATGETWRTYTVFSVAQVDGSMIDDARVSVDPQENRPFVSLTFNRRGGEVFARVTEENVKKRFAIVLDDRVNSAPQIQQRIGGGSARITLGGDSDFQQTMREASQHT